MNDADTGELWNAFHRVVNMTSRELEDWLRTASADPDHEAGPATDPPRAAGTEWIRGAGVPQRTAGHRAPHRSAVAHEEEDR